MPSVMLSPIDGTATVTSANAAAEPLIPRALKSDEASNRMHAVPSADAAQCVDRVAPLRDVAAPATAGQRGSGEAAMLQNWHRAVAACSPALASSSKGARMGRDALTCRDGQPRVNLTPFGPLSD